MLFEDLAYRNPTHFPNGFATLNYGQAERILESMARFHAQTWNSSAFEKGGKWGLETPVGDNAVRIRSLYFDILPCSEHWTWSAISPRGAAMPRLLRDADRMEEGWFRLVDLLTVNGKVIVQGYEHLGNFFVEPDGTPGLYDMLSRGEAWHAYRCSSICPLMIWLTNSSIWQPEAINTARAAAAVLDHDSFGLLGM